MFIPFDDRDRRDLVLAYERMAFLGAACVREGTPRGYILLEAKPVFIELWHAGCWCRN